MYILRAPFISLSITKLHLEQVNTSFDPTLFIVPHTPQVLLVYSSVFTIIEHPRNLQFDSNLLVLIQVDFYLPYDSYYLTVKALSAFTSFVYNSFMSHYTK